LAWLIKDALECLIWKLGSEHIEGSLDLRMHQRVRQHRPKCRGFFRLRAQRLGKGSDEAGILLGRLDLNAY
jgi:hypothetical protein